MFSKIKNIMNQINEKIKKKIYCLKNLLFSEYSFIILFIESLILNI